MQSVKNMITSLGHFTCFMHRFHLRFNGACFMFSVSRQMGLEPPCCTWQSQGTGLSMLALGRMGHWLAEVWVSHSLHLIWPWEGPKWPMTVMSTDWRATYWLAGMGLVLGTDHQASCSAAMVGLAIEAAAGKAGGLPRCSSLIPDAPEAPSTHNFPSSHAVRPTATCSLPSAQKDSC